MADLQISLLTDVLLDGWLEANISARGPQHQRRLMSLWQEALDGKKLIWAAWDEAKFAGHISLQFVSEYPPFRKGKIPEIVDLWVQPEYRRHGAGRQLLEVAIKAAREINAPAIGMGVGITQEYGAAHRLYALAGFAPDGSGLWVDGHQAKPGDIITLDHAAMSMWQKNLAG